MYSPFLDEVGNQIHDIKKINIEHIDNMVSRKVPEGWFLDYKREFSNKYKQKFSEDVCAFLNTDGGWLILGIQEDSSGMPEKIIGIEGKGLHDEIQQIIISNISPKPFFEIKILKFESNNVVIIKIYPGNSTPYIHTKKGIIYIRSGEGKEQIRTTSLKTKYVLDTLYQKSEDKIDEFLKEFELPYSIPDEQSYINISLFVSPFSSFDFGADYFSSDFRKKIINSFKDTKHYFGDGNIEIQKIHIINLSWYIEFSYGTGVQHFAQLKRNGVLILFIPIIRKNIEEMSTSGENKNLDTLFSLSGEEYSLDYIDVFDLSITTHLILEGFKNIYCNSNSYNKSIHEIRYNLNIECAHRGDYIFYDSERIIGEMNKSGIPKTIHFYGKKINKHNVYKTLWDSDKDKNIIFGEMFMYFGIIDFETLELYIKEFEKYLSKIFGEKK